MSRVSLCSLRGSHQGLPLEQRRLLTALQATILSPTRRETTALTKPLPSLKTPLFRKYGCKNGKAK